jgi:two-component system sensor histidine kinase/response regulator
MKRILVIEDQQALRQLLSRMLTLEGFEVVTANNGSNGIAAAKQKLPDLIFCDLKMPELDGYGVLCAIRADERTAHIPVVFVTASAGQAERESGLKRGAAAYLTKPFRREDILETIKRCT